jgi:hypothetical protein
VEGETSPHRPLHDFVQNIYLRLSRPN